MNSATATTHPDDIFVWPDDSWCYRANVYEMQHMSDDYRTYYVNTTEYMLFVQWLIDESYLNECESTDEIHDPTHVYDLG